MTLLIELFAPIHSTSPTVYRTGTYSYCYVRDCYCRLGDQATTDDDKLLKRKGKESGNIVQFKSRLNQLSLSHDQTDKLNKENKKPMS